MNIELQFLRYMKPNHIQGYSDCVIAVNGSPSTITLFPSSQLSINNLELHLLKLINYNNIQ